MGVPVEKMIGLGELAELLGVPTATIYAWRHAGTGPRGYRVGRHIRFTAEDVSAWLESNADAPRPAA